MTDGENKKLADIIIGVHENEELTLTFSPNEVDYELSRDEIVGLLERLKFGILNIGVNYGQFEQGS